MSKILNVAPIKQGNDTDWCWAACHAMVINFLGKPAGPVRMCELVAFLRRRVQHTSQPDCCAAAPGDVCKTRNATTDEMNMVLTKFEVSFNFVAGRIGRDALLDQINGERPVEITIDWRFSPGSHVVVVRGWLERVNAATDRTYTYFVVNDPWKYEPGEEPGPGYVHYIAYSELTTYRNQGDWIETWKDLA